MNFPTVYIIVLNWNGWRDTIDCIDSLKKLDYTNYKIVVVDNFSTNDSVQRISNEHPDIIMLLSPANLGFAGGNNIGIEYALERGASYVWLINNDTNVDAKALTSLVGTAEADERIGAVGSRIFDFVEPHNIQAWGGGKVSFLTGRSRHLFGPGHLEYITGASLLLKREVLKTVGLLDDRYFMYWEDVDLGFKIRKAGWTLAVSQDSMVYHKESVSLGKTNPLMDVYYSKSSVRFFARHSRYALWPISVGCAGRIYKRIRERSWKRAHLTIRSVLLSLYKTYISKGKPGV